MKKYFPGNTGPGDHTTKEVFLNYLTWYLFQSFCLLVSGTVPILKITKYFSCNYIEASVTWQGESFVLFFSPVRSLLQMLTTLDSALHQVVLSFNNYLIFIASSFISVSHWFLFLESFPAYSVFSHPQFNTSLTFMQSQNHITLEKEREWPY